MTDVERLVAEAVAAEREACARLCKSLAEQWYGRNTRWQHHQGAAIGADKCADAIRARAHKTTEGIQHGTSS